MSGHSNLIATEFTIQMSPYSNQTPLLHTDSFDYEMIAHCNVSDHHNHYNHLAYIAASANYLQRPCCQLLWQCSRTKPK